jgi:hypothetical protein
MFVFDNDHHAEFSSNANGAFEKFFDLFRSRVRGDVKILRFASEQKITHTTADPERGETSSLQTADNLNCSFLRRKIHPDSLP